jgi:hypothetical protein
MWVMLTFFWGAGALWPRCKFGGGGDSGKGPSSKMCDEPLMEESNGKKYRKCSRTKCDNGAVWCCPKGHRHDGMCRGCVQKVQINLLGSGDHKCSTDVYDGEIVGFRGTTYHLSSVRSRKHPKVCM